MLFRSFRENGGIVFPNPNAPTGVEMPLEEVEDIIRHNPDVIVIVDEAYVDIGFKIDERTGRIVMMGALDNLVKGAAGQAVQNMNLLFGFDEAEGLCLVPMFP